MDEDFRRGRPVYNDTRNIGLKLQKPSNHNLPIRPSYNVYNPNARLLNYGYGNTGFGVSRIGANGLRFNNVNVGTGLDRLGRGGSYDVYGRGVNPLYNRVGLTPVNANNIQQSNIKDFLWIKYNIIFNII